MKHEFNAVLQVGADEMKAEEKKQEKLKKKFGLQGKNVVVVEKNNLLRFAFKTIGHMFHFFANLILFLFAFVGIVALFYEAPRKEMAIILKEVIREINRAVSTSQMVAFFGR